MFLSAEDKSCHSYAQNFSVMPHLRVKSNIFMGSAPHAHLSVGSTSHPHFRKYFLLLSPLLLSFHPQWPPCNSCSNYLSCLRAFALVLTFPKTVFSQMSLCLSLLIPLRLFFLHFLNKGSSISYKMSAPRCHPATHFPHLALVFSVLLIIPWHIILFYINC